MFPQLHVCLCSVTQLCPTLTPMDCSSPDSSVHGIYRARILKWVAIASSRDLPDPGIKPMSPALAGGFFTTEPPGKPTVTYFTLKYLLFWKIHHRFHLYFIKLEIFLLSKYQFSSVTQSCPTLCNPMDCSTPGFPVHPQLPTCSNSCPLSWCCHATISSSVIPFSSCLQSSPASGSFPMSNFTSGGQSIVASASASVLPRNIQDWFPLQVTGLISLQSKGLSRVFSSTTILHHQFSINSLALRFLYGPTLITIYNYWKNHSFDKMDLCWQSNVSVL